MCHGSTNIWFNLTGRSQRILSTLVILGTHQNIICLPLGFAKIFFLQNFVLYGSRYGGLVTAYYIFRTIVHVNNSL